MKPLAKNKIPISIDTKGAVAARQLRLVRNINDISALADKKMGKTAAHEGRIDSHACGALRKRCKAICAMMTSWEKSLLICKKHAKAVDAGVEKERVVVDRASVWQTAEDIGLLESALKRAAFDINRHHINRLSAR